MPVHLPLVALGNNVSAFVRKLTFGSREGDQFSVNIGLIDGILDVEFFHKVRAHTALFFRLALQNVPLQLNLQNQYQ